MIGVLAGDLKLPSSLFKGNQETREVDLMIKMYFILTSELTYACAVLEHAEVK